MNKKIVIVVTIILIILISIAALFGYRAYKKSYYATTDEYVVKEQKFPSVKSVVGEKKIKSYSYTKEGSERLELYFEDADKEKTVEQYINKIKDSSFYTEVVKDNPNEREIARKDGDLITVKTEITDDGFKLEIEVGDGYIQFNLED